MTARYVADRVRQDERGRWSAIDPADTAARHLADDRNRGESPARREPPHGWHRGPDGRRP